MGHYDTNFDKNNANYVPLTPLTFLKRAKEIYPNYEAVIYEDRKYTWDQIYKRTVKFASALNKIGIGKGDTVSFLAFNTPEIFEGHYSVPMTGAVLNTINIRLDAKTIAYAWIKVLEVSFKDYNENKNFYDDKIDTARFYFDKVLPRVEQHYKSAISGSSNLMNFKFN